MKTVYILGAGFSMDAGAPSQAQIIKGALELYESEVNLNDEDFHVRFKRFKDLLVNKMYFSEDQLCDVILEDIFTPLDRCMSENMQYRGIPVGEIMNTREDVFHVIGYTIKEMIKKSKKDKKYIEDFAAYLVKESKKRAEIRKKEGDDLIDPVSVISTNWDIMLDDSIYNAIPRGKHEPFGVVDYCCYISSTDEHDETVKPGLLAIGKDGYNVKLLKLHGSLNWLQCPRCMRLYTIFGKENFGDDHCCRHCTKNFGEAEKSTLISNLIMPTFIKDLSNPQYKIIWQNAGIEISEADKLVFIGYSLPSADFELRQLLSRMSKRNAEIEVVTFVDDEEDKEVIKSKQEAIIKHWTGFFGIRPIEFHFNGAKKYIERNIKY
ncbi:Uncharacterised protein [Serratia liquefaciens]|uniref:hypothetical protein n=1 Tax=Serratia liquefaciens TaxID=614 RepID=UPI00217A6E66|nr:hypothetical protein [Serratia liquefaciens]CAI0997511.1 Uncharacterised protein [Serratia liquefaciens]CAI1520420.1 Uncharacterised protein [Serratia liquefaciens]